MIFPIGDDQVVGGYKPLWSYVFIGVNVVIFLYQVYMTATLGQEWLSQFYMTYGHVPAYTEEGHHMYSYLSNMFLHGGWMHLIGNMVFLWVFADNIEATIGPVLFVLFYLAAGVAASLTHGFFNPGSMVPGVGASGAIAGVLGAYLVLYPRSRIRMLVLIFFSSFYIPAFVFLLFWIGQQLVAGVGSLQGAPGGGVAWWAHIGGFVFGIVIGALLRLRIQPKRLVA